MKGLKTISEKPATGEQIFAILENYRRSEFPREKPFERESTVHEWLSNLDVWTDWRFFGKSLNEEFELAVSENEWCDLLTPVRKRTLKEVCEFVAARVSLPQLATQTIMGRRCPNGSAFLALRLRLEQQGVDMTNIRPSTRLDDFLRQHYQSMVKTLVRVAPGKFSEFKFKWRNNFGYTLCRIMWFVSAVALAASLFGHSGVRIYPVLGFGFGFLGLHIFSRLPFQTVSIAGYETFADLSRSIASGNISKQPMA